MFMGVGYDFFSVFLSFGVNVFDFVLCFVFEEFVEGYD